MGREISSEDREFEPVDNDGKSDLDAGSGGAVEKVSEIIVRGIRSGAFVPGQHLLEPDLTRRLGISRGSLREALKHLSAEGIVTLNRFRGAYIATLDRKSVLDLLETLEPLARLAARLAAVHCDTPEMRDRLIAATTAIESASRSRNRADYLEQRRNFYSTLIEIGGNRELERVMPLTRTDLFRAQVETIQTEKQRQRHAAGYGRIAKAVLDRNVAAADRAVKRHFDGTRKTMDELPLESFAAFNS
jgi:DNA-binding GntR family transcriptional regulator